MLNTWRVTIFKIMQKGIKGKQERKPVNHFVMNKKEQEEYSTIRKNLQFSSILKNGCNLCGNMVQ